MSDRPGFWKRQFLLPPTSAQAVWDLLFGIVLPLTCLVGDQILFGGSNHVFRGSVFGPWKTLAYAFILTEVALLGVWMLVRRRARRSAAFFGGPLLAGTVFSFVTALAFLPLSVIGLIFVIGILGFSPWFTGFAFYRNWKMAKSLSGGRTGFWLTVAGIVFAVTPAVVLETRGHYLIQKLIENPTSSRRLSQAERLPLLSVENLVQAWAQEPDPARKLALAEAHERLTGTRLDERDD